MYAMAVSPAGWTRGRSDNGKRTGQLRQLPLFPKSGRWLSILAGAFKGPRYRYVRAQNSMLTILLRRERDIDLKRSWVRRCRHPSVPQTPPFSIPASFLAFCPLSQISLNPPRPFSPFSLSLSHLFNLTLNTLSGLPSSQSLIPSTGTRPFKSSAIKLLHARSNGP